jgi:hypothetical protein
VLVTTTRADGYALRPTPMSPALHAAADTVFEVTIGGNDA